MRGFRVLCILVFFWCDRPCLYAEPEPRTLTVMTWNIWGRLNQDPRYTIDGLTARQRTIEIIKGSNVDIIAMVETYGSARDIANALGFHHYTPAPGANLSLFSRYELTDFGTPEGLSSFSFIRATAKISATEKVKVYCIWLTSGGRHIVEIKNEELSDKAFIDGDNIRLRMMRKFLNHPEVKADVAGHETVPVIVAGDFNCVSRLDYSESSKALNYGRVFGATPTHDLMMESGFVDAFRRIYPKVTKDTLGHTWTTVGPDFVYESGRGFVPVKGGSHPRPHFTNPYARIDFIYALGSLRPKSAAVIKNFRDHGTRSFPEFPSDHAAVVASFELGGENKAHPAAPEGRAHQAEQDRAVPPSTRSGSNSEGADEPEVPSQEHGR